MKRRSLMAGCAGLLLMLLAATMVIAQSSSHFDAGWNVLAGGGGHATGSHYAFDATLGQAVAGSAAGSGTRIVAGYWQAFPAYKLYLPLLLRYTP